MQQLCFSVCFEKVAYTVIDTVNTAILKHAELRFKSRTSEDIKDELKAWLLQEDKLNFSGEVSLSFSGMNCTLIPQNLFGEIDKQGIYAFNFGKTEHEVDYNRFPELGLMTIYELPQWLKSFFVLRYPSIVIQHESTHLIRGIFKGGTFRPTVYIAAENTFFYLLLVDKNKLLFFNTFSCSTVEDYVYYILFILKQQALEEKELSIRFYEHTKESTLFNDFQSTIKKIHPDYQMQFHAYETAKFQLLCV